jgi:hypothetical protein
MGRTLEHRVDQVVEQTAKLFRLDFVGNRFRPVLVLIDESVSLVEYAGFGIELSDFPDSFRRWTAGVDERQQLLLAGWGQAFQRQSPQDGRAATEQITAGA